MAYPENSGAKLLISLLPARSGTQPFSQEFGMEGSDPPMDHVRRTTGVAPSWNPPPDASSPQEQQMSATKLSRLAGLVFVLAAVFGGAGAASASIEHETVDSSVAIEAPTSMRLMDTVWS